MCLFFSFGAKLGKGIFAGPRAPRLTTGPQTIFHGSDESSRVRKIESAIFRSTCAKQRNALTAGQEDLHEFLAPFDVSDVWCLGCAYLGLDAENEAKPKH